MSKTGAVPSPETSDRFAPLERLYSLREKCFGFIKLGVHRTSQSRLRYWGWMMVLVSSVTAVWARRRPFTDVPVPSSIPV